MKKSYSKPDIMYESFRVTTNITSSCDGGAEMLASDYECGKTFSNGQNVFLTGVQGCGIKVSPDQDGDGMWGTLCYHVPLNLTALLES